MEVIYLDSLFLLNTAIDYLLLLVTGRICALPLRRRRIFLGGALGGLYAMLCSLRPDVFALWTVKLLAGTLLVLAAYGLGRGRARTAAVFFAVSAAFGGAVFCASTLGGTSPAGTAFVPVSLPVLALSFALCYASLCLAFRYSGKQAVQRLAEVRVSLSGREAIFTALEDTGNELTDPVSGAPVLVAEVRALAPLFPAGLPPLVSGDPAESFAALSQSPEFRGRLRLLPCSSVAGGSALLLCFRPDGLSLNGRKSGHLIALTSRALSGDGRYQALVCPERV